ncbi:MAG: acyltransferase [Microthrixaceae bacterium]
MIGSTGAPDDVEPAGAGSDAPFRSVAPRLGFVPGFDGMRGVGVLMVLVAHLFPERTDSFNPIVDVFFVLSAFLIVTLLMQEHRNNGRVDLRRFYSRRAVRLLPNSFACMAAWLVVYGIVKVAGIHGTVETMDQVNAIPRHVAAAAGYVYHLVYPVGSKPGPLVQFWSLSIEEQFYLVAGFAMVFALASRRRVRVACGLMVVLVVWIGWSRWRVDLGPWPGREYSTDAWTRGLRLLWLQRPDALLVGVLLAVFNALLPDPLSSRARRWIVVAGVLGVIGWFFVLTSSLSLHAGGQGRILPYWVPGVPRDPSQLVNFRGAMWCAREPVTGAVPMPPHPGSPYRPCTEGLWIFRWGFTAIALAVAPLTLCMARCKDAWISRAFSWAPMRKIGEMSYSLYVWHLLAFSLAGLVVPGLGTAAASVVKVVAAFAVSWLAHRYIDLTVLRVKMRFAADTVVLDRTTGRGRGAGHDDRARWGRGLSMNTRAVWRDTATRCRRGGGSTSLRPRRRGRCVRRVRGPPAPGRSMAAHTRRPPIPRARPGSGRSAHGDTGDHARPVAAAPVVPADRPASGSGAHGAGAGASRGDPGDHGLVRGSDGGGAVLPGASMPVRSPPSRGGRRRVAGVWSVAHLLHRPRTVRSGDRGAVGVVGAVDVRCP